jgi:hypothetical protein
MILTMSTLVATACAQALSQTAPGAQPPSAVNQQIDLPVAQWLAQGERKEIPWKLALSRPVITFRLLNLLTVTAEVKASALERQGPDHDLRLIVKVAPEKGSWNDGESYSNFRVDRGITSKLYIRAGVYLKPGTYTVAAILYDAATGRRNLSLHRVQVPDPHSGQVSDLLSATPAINFIGSPENAGPLGPRLVPLAVESKRAILLDLIVDLSTREQDERRVLIPPGSDARTIGSYDAMPDLQHWPSVESLPRTRHRTDSARQQTAEQRRLQEIAGTLSKMDFRPGCTRITALDVLRLRTLLPPTPVGDVDWQELGKENTIPHKLVVTLANLEDRKQAGFFFQKQIRQTMATPPPCSSPNPLRVIAVISHGINFPSGSQKPKIEPRCDCKVFYFHKSDQEIGDVDDLKKMLQTLSPRVLDFANPGAFREKVVEFVELVKKVP